MVKYADESDEAMLLQKQQSRRLMHFRRVLGLSRTIAAEMAGVSRFTWRRMEDGTARIDTVPLRRFLAAYARLQNLPGEYILSGSTVGLPEQMARDLLRLSFEEPEDFGGNSSPPSADSGGRTGTGIVRKPQQRRRANSGTRSGAEDLMAA